jgi:hypothetical protein
MAEVRNRWIHVKCSLGERDQWQNVAKAHGVPLSDLIRSRLANDSVRPKRTVLKGDPELLRHVARIGSNINQIARRINVGHMESVMVVAILLGIERELEELLKRSESHAD